MSVALKQASTAALVILTAALTHLPQAALTADSGTTTQSAETSPFDLAWRHHTGDGVLQNYAQAATLLQQAAKQGDARAQNLLGQYLFSGLGLPQDRTAALKMFSAAAAGGDPQYLYDHAAALEDSAPAEAVRAYEAAAQQGHAEAAVSLGVMYQEGRGVAQDYGRAIALYKAPAAAGHGRALNNLGLLLVRGDGVEQDYQQAAQLFENAAQQGLPTALTNLSVMYENGFGVPQDDAQAEALARQASNLRQSRAAGSTSTPCPFDARLVPPAEQDQPALTRAAEAGDPVAQFLTGWMLCSEGSASAARTAAARFRAAADSGHGPAMTALAQLYLDGRGLPQDYQSAFTWLTLAASAGDFAALARKAILLPRMTSGQVNAAQAEAQQIWQAQQNPAHPANSARQ